MKRLHPWKISTATLAAITMSVSAIAPAITLSPVNAQTNNGNYRIGQLPGFGRSTTISRGARIPTKYEKDKIFLVPGETMQVTLKVANNLVERPGGPVLVPMNSQIRGEFVPVTRNSVQGTQFVAREIIFPTGERENINANSNVITRTEKIRRGAKAGEILRDAGYGTAAAAVIALLTGNRQIEWGELLIGGSVGSIYRVIKGGREADLLAVDTKQDLTLVLNSPLTVPQYR